MYNIIKDRKVRNYTPHPLNLVRKDGDEIQTYPSQGVARVTEELSPPVYIEIDEEKVPLVGIRQAEIIGLPPVLQDGDLYIVSLPVMAAATPEQRRHMAYPYPLVRDSAGRVVGCGGFARLLDD